ncbi:MAG: BrnA antitoxin family protein [Pseudoxanthomonas sp.]
MNAKKTVSARTLKSDLDRVDSHRVRRDEYEELPELSEEMMARGSVKRAGRPVARDPRRQVTIRLPASVLAAWKATGPGWQTRMADQLSRQA